MTAKTIADAIASDRPEQADAGTGPLAASDDRARAAVGDQQRDVVRRREDQRLGRDLERPLGPGRLVGVRRAAAGSRAGSMAGAATGRPIPNPGIAALPQAAAGSSARVPAARAAARSAATSGSSTSPIRARPEVGAGRVGQVGEGEGPADDRDRVARLQPRSRGTTGEPPPLAAPRPAVARCRPGRGPRSSVVDLRSACRARPSGSTPRVRSASPAGSSPSMPVSVLASATGASNRAPRGKTRSSPVSSRTRKPDRALLDVARRDRSCRRRRRRRPRGSRRRARSGAARRGSSRRLRSTPLTRTSPAAIDAIAEVDVSAMRVAIPCPRMPRPRSARPPTIPTPDIGRDRRDEGDIHRGIVREHAARSAGPRDGGVPVLVACRMPTTPARSPCASLALGATWGSPDEPREGRRCG